MLNKTNRLKKKKDFETVFKKGKSFKNSFLIIRIASNKLQFSRFGLVVSQKVSKKAVVRNKVRRRMSEIIRKRIKEIKVGLDVVLIALSGLEKKSFLETEEAITSLFKKIKII